MKDINRFLKDLCYWNLVDKNRWTSTFRSWRSPTQRTTHTPQVQILDTDLNTEQLSLIFYYYYYNIRFFTIAQKVIFFKETCPLLCPEQAKKPQLTPPPPTHTIKEYFIPILLGFNNKQKFIILLRARKCLVQSLTQDFRLKNRKIFYLKKREITVNDHKTFYH